MSDAPEPLMRYDVGADELVPVTQEWVDQAQRRLKELAELRRDIRHLVNAPYIDMSGVVRNA